MKRFVEVTGTVQHIILTMLLEGERYPVPVLPPVVGGAWGTRNLDDHWGNLRVDGPTLIWEAVRKDSTPFDAELSLDNTAALRNYSASLALADGRTIKARFGNATRDGHRPGLPRGLTAAFDVWTTESEGRPVAHWVGTLKGGGFLNRNFAVSGPGRGLYCNMRLEGNYTWFIVDRDPGKEVDLEVVLEPGPAPLNHDLLGNDFVALEFVLGAPLQLDVLVGLDEPGNIIDCAGVRLGGNRVTKRRKRADGPVPDDVAAACWAPVLFSRLTRAMTERPNLPWSVAVNAYLDAMTDATLDGGYLKLQVGLEAFAKALAQESATEKNESRFLVKDKNEWTRWVHRHADELRAMVVDAARGDIFISKIKSAMNLPSSSAVAEALARLQPPLHVDEKVLSEVQQRNIPAHHFRMNKPGVDYDVDREMQRIDMLRSLLVALVARACGYDGIISGWRTFADVWKPPPGWWPVPGAASLEQAGIAYFCERKGRVQRSESVVRSRFKKWPQKKR